MPTNDPDRLRAALDQIANALQPAVLVAAQLQRESAVAARDAATLDNALRTRGGDSEDFAARPIGVVM